MMSRRDNRDQPVCVTCRKTIMRENHLPLDTAATAAVRRPAELGDLSADAQIPVANRHPDLPM